MTTQIAPRAKTEIGEGIGSAVLLALMFLTVSSSVAASGWIGKGLDVPFWGAVGGFALGIPIARSRVRGVYAHLVMIGLGAFATLYLAMFLAPPQLYPPERLQILVESWRVWLDQMAAKNASHEVFPFVMQLIYVLWLFAYFSAWFLYRRRQVWGAILFPSLVIVVNLFQTAEPQVGLYLGIFVVCVFLLLIRYTLFSFERVWHGATIGYSADIGFDFFLYGALFTILLVALAWTLPPSAPGPSWLAFLQPLEEPWHGIENNLQRGFGGLNPVGRPLPNPNTSVALFMGGPIKLTQKPVMQVSSPVGRYWRSAVYDQYTGAGFVNSHKDVAQLEANDTRFSFNVGVFRQEITQTIQTLAPEQTLLFAAAQPIRFDVAIEARFAQYAAPTTSILDLGIARPRRAMREGEKYSVVSAITLADEDSLRESTRNYPEWITGPYLALPAALPKRVRDLAREIAAKSKNPYDQAVALEAYLRSQIKYNELVAPPPPNRDAVDYFLFDRPEGYCNYYASAMVVLARAVGIPARVASGFARGENRGGVFYVVEANSHAWPELYFAGYGWIEFEPTVIQPPIERPRRENPAESDANDPSPTQLGRRRDRDAELDPETGINRTAFNPFFFAFFQDPASLALLGGGTILALALAIVVIAQLQQRRRFAHLAPAARAYEELLRRARWIGVAAQTYATPFEMARVIGVALPRAQAPVAQVAALYVRERFGAHALNPDQITALKIARREIMAAWLQGMGQQLLGRGIALINRVVEWINELSARAEKKKVLNSKF